MVSLKISCLSRVLYKQNKLLNDLNLIRILMVNPSRLSSSSIDCSKTEKTINSSLGSFKTNHKKELIEWTFEDSELAFKSKSNLELLRAYLVFGLCSVNYLVDNQLKLLGYSRRILGESLFNLMMKASFYGHFVAGENKDAIRPKVNKMLNAGVRSILDFCAEADLKNKNNQIDKNDLRRIFNESEQNFNNNAKRIKDCIDAVADVTQSTGIAALKFTSLIRPDLLLKLSILINQLEHHDTNSADSSSSNRNRKNLFAVERFLNKNQNELSNVFGDLSKLKVNVEFDSNELEELFNVYKRLNDIFKFAAENNVRVFVDAEQTYFQPAIRRLAIEFMRIFNKDKCLIFNTYQNYLKCAFNTLKEDIELATREDFCFGAKLVRGAYMEQERERAKQMNYEDPINDNYDETTKMYEKSLIYCMDQVREKPLGRICVMVASHNEQTVKFAVETMEKLQIKKESNVVYFGQLLGMCDFISFYLGQVGYSAYKVVPYGPVDRVLPYLTRRANENRGIFDKVKKEKRLIFNELKRRVKSLQFS